VIVNGLKAVFGSRQFGHVNPTITFGTCATSTPAQMLARAALDASNVALTQFARSRASRMVTASSGSP
jgi:hypothetical protein